MADPKGFLKHTERTTPTSRPVEERVKDWNEVYTSTRIDLPILTDQASRCMNCGVPFCHKGCPLGNIIPEWNDMVHRGQWDEAVDRLPHPGTDRVGEPLVVVAPDHRDHGPHHDR